jgi:hyaluronan synthase
MPATVERPAREPELGGKSRITVRRPPRDGGLGKEADSQNGDRRRTSRSGGILPGRGNWLVRLLFFMGLMSFVGYGLRAPLAVHDSPIAPDAKPGIPRDEPPQAERELGKKQDFHPHCRQRISTSGRILVSKKAWAARVLFFMMIVAFTAYGLKTALAAHDPLIAYSMFVLVHSTLILIYGWFVFKTRTRGEVPNNLVSVIVPVYNQEQLIEGVLNAIEGSSYSNLEVVAINDGSKDKTGEVLDALAVKNPKLRVIHKPNGGKRTAVAAGFYAAKGDYVVLIDSDSIVDKYAIEEFMKIFGANHRVGGIVGDGKPLNADKNLLTRCQDVWYDGQFNIHKAAESAFGTVLCLSGCLSAYRREAISRFIPYWSEEKVQYSDDRSLTTYTLANEWAKANFAPLERRLMEEVAAYDDADDRTLTSQTLKEWETVYAPTAVVYTEVPEGFGQYLRQQIRWRKGYLRSNFFASSFFWRKNPIMALIFYMEFISSLLLPAIAFSIFFYRPLFLGPYSSLLAFIAGQMLMGLVFGLDYRFRDPSARTWLYKPLMNLISVCLLSWITLLALWSLRQNKWLTR